MKKTPFLLLIAVAILANSGCDEDSTCSADSCCKPGCKGHETCYRNACIDLSEHPEVCIPQCTGKSICSNHECVDITAHPEVCIPSCEAPQVCMNNRCVGPDDSCDPQCTGTQKCQNGHCVETTECQGLMCKNSQEYCDESGQWQKCASGTGCHLGHCIRGIANECDDDMCSADGSSVCQGGAWIDCDSAERCVEQDEHAECVVDADSCLVGTCSENGRYRCGLNGHWEPCGGGMRCSGGKCIEDLENSGFSLFALCRADSECSSGHCVKQVRTSRPLTKFHIGIAEPTDVILLSQLENRIPEGYGVCSADCTQNPAVCGQISTAKDRYSCQVVIVGDSPYPPLDEFRMPRSLPFSTELDLREMEISPFGALCRPNDPQQRAYSDHFCEACDNSDACAKGESCIYGACLPQCTTDNECPLGFSCQPYGEGGSRFCIPPEGSCEACIDRDGDGQGVGHCARRGFDCDDLDPGVRFTGELPAACTDKVEDTNCNGMVDRYELLGTPAHCGGCDDECHPVADSHIERHCDRVDESVTFDVSSIQGLEQSFRFTCYEACSVGYANCDGNSANGCETKLVDLDAERTRIEALHEGTVYAVDVDGDGYALPDASGQIFCCSGDETNQACYRLSPGDAKDDVLWDNAERPSADSVYIAVTADSLDKLHDCDDGHANVYPGAKEYCDGLNNDCNPQTPDGADDVYTVEYGDGTQKSFGLGDACSLYYDTPQNIDSVGCGFGVAACTLEGTSTFRMRCISSTNAESTELGMCEEKWNGIADKSAYCADICNMTEETCAENCRKSFIQKCTCNGIDDDCDGRVDEDWEFEACTIEGNVGVCALGVRTCNQVASVDPVSGHAITTPTISCQPLFYKSDGRGYDFYGDGVDSNCDGEDFDRNSTIFVTPYFGSGALEPHENQSTGEQVVTSRLGLYDSPYVSLKKALSVACSRGTDGVRCRDILVNADTGIRTYRDWLTESVEIPVYASDEVYRPEFYTHERKNADGTTQNVGTWTHEELVAEYARLWKEAAVTHNGYESFTVSADTSKYLLEGEVYPKELVRIIGGMHMQEITDADGKLVPKWTQSGRTKYDVKIEYAEDGPTYDYRTSQPPVHIILKPNAGQSDVNSMSLYLDSFHFGMTGKLKTPSTMKALRSANAYRGVTFIGLSCGSNGCRDITVRNTDFEITAPEGLSADMKHFETRENGWNAYGLSSLTGSSNDIWDPEVKKAYVAENGDASDNQGEMNNFVQCWDANRCLRPGQKGDGNKWTQNYTSWLNYYESYYSGFKGACPDGALPFGGCGGGVCTKDDCANLGGNPTRGGGRAGWGANGGSGGSGGTNKRDNCDEGTWCDASFNGANGANGAPGKGGKVLGAFKSIALTQVIPPSNAVSDHVYFTSNPQNGDGEYGRSGGGGGGGGVCRAYTRSGLFNSRFVYAAGGGAGGCGGWPGHAGGTGGSAVGMFLTPPFRQDETLVFTPISTSSDNRIVTVKPGAGGSGQDGQIGIAGAAGAGSKGWYDSGHCEVTGSGGSGGTGGSSGGGAAGSTGVAYAFLFACNREGYDEDHPFAVLNESTVHPDGRYCGFEFRGSLAQSVAGKAYGAVETVHFGSDGGDAVASQSGTPGTYGLRGTGASDRATLDDHGMQLQPYRDVYHYVYIRRPED